MSWILNLVSRDIGEIIMSDKISREMLEELKNQLSQDNGLMVFQLQKELSSLSQEQTSMNVYYFKFKCLWDEFLNHSQIKWRFFHIRGQILLIESLPSIT